jgi:hypothetical protein
MPGMPLSLLHCWLGRSAVQLLHLYRCRRSSSDCHVQQSANNRFTQYDSHNTIHTIRFIQYDSPAMTDDLTQCCPLDQAKKLHEWAGPPHCLESSAKLPACRLWNDLQPPAGPDLHACSVKKQTAGIQQIFQIQPAPCGKHIHTFWHTQTHRVTPRKYRTSCWDAFHEEQQTAISIRWVPPQQLYVLSLSDRSHPNNCMYLLPQGRQAGRLWS